MKKSVREIYATPVDLSLEDMECRQKMSFRVMPKYKMVTYIDSSECTSCALEHLVWWNALIEETRERGKNINYIFIIAPKKGEEKLVCENLSNFGLNASLYVDTKCLFSVKNKFVSKGKMFRSFLLNEDNKIIFLGYPNSGDKSYDLYQKTISQLN